MIVNADDFGKSALVNSAILHCFQHSLCSSATIMATGASFDEACAMVHDHRLLDHMGVHLVLDAGIPLTEGIRCCRRLCDHEGRLLPRSLRLFLTSDEKRCLAREIAAQIEKTQSRGIPITHLDSHHHVHELWPILSIVLKMARNYDIPYLRLAANCGPRNSLPLKLYRRCVNERIRWRGMARTQYFGSLANFLWHLQSWGLCSRDTWEVMIHPTWGHKQNVVDEVDTDIPLEVRFPREFRAGLVSYTGHRYEGT